MFVPRLLFALLLCSILPIVFPGLALSQIREYTVNTSESVFSFKIEHFGVATVNGVFGSGSGTVRYDPTQRDSVSARIVLNVASINTDNKLRDRELRSEDFLDSDRYPTVEFVSDTVTRASQTQRLMSGRMTVYGTTLVKAIPFSTELNASADRLTVRSQFTLTRKEFKLKFGILMDSLIGDTIEVSVVMVANATEPRK